MNFRAWWPLWLQWTVLGCLLLAICVGLWVRFALQVVAIDGTEECGACHIMRPFVEDLKRSGHAGEANCGDCHVPQESLVGSYVYKAQQGVKNVTAEYQLYSQGKLDSFVPKASDETKRIVVENCYRCHDEIAEGLNGGLIDMGSRAVVDNLGVAGNGNAAAGKGGVATGSGDVAAESGDRDAGSGRRNDALGRSGTVRVQAEYLPVQGAINCLECHTGLVHDDAYRTPSEEQQPVIPQPSADVTPKASAENR